MGVITISILQACLRIPWVIVADAWCLEYTGDLYIGVAVILIMTKLHALVEAH